MFWELFQQWRIDQADWNASEARSVAKGAEVEARVSQRRLRELEEQVDRMSLTIMAMAEFMQQRMGLSESELQSRVSEIDLRDGTLDGRLRQGVKACPECHRPNAAVRHKCLYCGEELSEA